jgi:hypothetical protein
VEIGCPPDCAYLSSARAHPAAVVQRRRDRDLRFLMPLVADLAEPQYRLLLAFQALVLKHAASALPAPDDLDVAEAAAAVAATIETERKGIIYEHQATSVPAQRLAAEIRGVITDIARQGHAGPVERDSAAALRRIEQAARTAGRNLDEQGGRAFLGLLERLMGSAANDDGEGPAESRPSLIVPP